MNGTKQRASANSQKNVQICTEFNYKNVTKSSALKSYQKKVCLPVTVPIVAMFNCIPLA